jgi:hypothetical protein
VFWREVQIAGFVAGAMTLVLLARRWTQLALGTGTLNQEFFAGNLAVGTLVSAVESRLGGGTRARQHPPQQPPRSTGAGVPGGPDDDRESE